MALRSLRYRLKDFITLRGRTAPPLNTASILTNTGLMIDMDKIKCGKASSFVAIPFAIRKE